MAKSSFNQIWWIVFNVAVGLFLAIGGIWALQGGGDSAAAAVGKLFGSNIMVTIFGVLELLSGIFIILQLIIGSRLRDISTIIKLIIVIIWAVAVVAGVFSRGNILALGNIYKLSLDLIVLTALLVSRD